MPRKNDRYRTLRDLTITCMTSWRAPFTGGHKCVLPAGEAFVVANDPPPGATAVYCDPVNYSTLESVLVPPEDRTADGYNGYYLCIPIRMILNHCERIEQTS